MTDYRALCTRMADELDHYRQLLMDDRRETHALATEARAALAQPQGEPMTNLSPAAQEVFWEFNRAASGKPDDWHYLPAIAAALRAAALTPNIDRLRLLAISDELESNA